ncbi:unnamed protein product [Lactuca saligna]|uniref:Uncharacterized protein n=1 Tax=Lactuca saligna TaxID=75948 RepID=A0AA35Z2W8_LACSI|nr:unnamed protein product [Lactuca saligna]
MHNAQDQKELDVDKRKMLLLSKLLGRRNKKGIKLLRKRKGSNQRVDGADGNKRKKKKGRKQVISFNSEEGDNQDDTSGTCVVGADLGDGGALLDIFRKEGTPKLKEYLKLHFREFRHSICLPLQQVIHPIHDQTFYLTMDHKRKLKEEFDCDLVGYLEYAWVKIFEYKNMLKFVIVFQYIPSDRKPPPEDHR